MAWPCGCDHGHGYVGVTLASVLLLCLASHTCYAFGTFGFNIHHRFSDPVKGILGIHHVPPKGTPQYYAALAHTDRIFRGRRLAADHHTPLTFAAGNDTHRIPAFGFLHFANVSIGTPPTWFEVALDTGSDLFWLPCNCTRCVRGLKTQSGKIFKLNIYDLDKSSTSETVSCNNNSFCKQSHCRSSGSSCRYQVDYLSNDTSSSGFLVEDVLHLITDDDQTKDSDTKITFGCGQIQTGIFLYGAAPNGLFGLGMGNVSVPSILAKEGLIANSFSMCFRSDGYGRITFGDIGNPNQGKTPFNLRALHPTYNVTITQIIVGEKVIDHEFHAIFDSGTSFTCLNDPAYTLIGEKFNSLVKADRHVSDLANSILPFEYCYNISPNQTVEVPFLNLTMKGGDDYFVMEAVVPVFSEDEGDLLCLGIQKSNNVNIIGQNFMSGYKIIFDRENMNLGWKESNCSDDVLSDSIPIKPSHSPAIAPAIAVNPVATSNPSINPPNSSFRIKPTFTIMIILFSLLAIF
ncbi:hypothetical protein RJT34_30576 [Clitoria ternatea]|uniref:Peptidase A1 domain-containing protein n=1 Tax=Clitoria ternatea TaxID=43366 RepID=A0AAN9ET31_CLITE